MREDFWMARLAKGNINGCALKKVEYLVIALGQSTNAQEMLAEFIEKYFEDKALGK